MSEAKIVTYYEVVVSRVEVSIVENSSVPGSKVMATATTIRVRQFTDLDRALSAVDKREPKDGS
ncbi:hypothetical protein LCGC14_1709360 [marine sediment metagenome]|uniref:Uncharacterized protein n=1 Tax=marine sediment metagenome TaxID=412755 RepID=A0A0F9HG82_9ZZZZ